jgi:hypothetical protein
MGRFPVDQYVAGLARKRMAAGVEAAERGVTALREEGRRIA